MPDGVITQCVLVAGVPSKSENHEHPTAVSQTIGSGGPSGNVQRNVSFRWFALMTCCSSQVAGKKLLSRSTIPDGKVARVTVERAWAVAATASVSVIATATTTS